MEVTHDYAIGIHVRLLLTNTFFNYHVSDRSVQYAFGTKNPETTVCRSICH